MVKVKICGHTRKSDIVSSALAGADAVGVVHGFPDSPREVSSPMLDELFAAVPFMTQSVLVTNEDALARLESPPTMNLQLHARPERLVEIRDRYPRLKIMPVLRVGSSMPPEEVVRPYTLFDTVCLDTYAEGMHGGTGRIHDWRLSKAISKNFSCVVLSGGLNPTNVQEAIRMVEPYGVDVSSGVESSPGIKDAEKVRKFVQMVRQID